MSKAIYPAQQASPRFGAISAQQPRRESAGRPGAVSAGSEAPAAFGKANVRGVKRDDIIFMSTQLAVMVDTGVPLAEALDSIAEQAASPGMKALVQDISEQVKGGVPLSEAMDRYPNVFGNLFVALMRASEASGQMGPMLQRASAYLQQERETRRKIKGAMIYPVCMLGFCALVVVALLAFVLPRFEKIYAGKGAALPGPTRFLLALSNGLVNNWALVLLFVAAAVTGVYFYVRSPSGRIMLDRIRIAAPILGGMYRKAYLARSLRTMATMVSTGVSMLDGLKISARVAGNHFYSQIWSDVAERVKEGSAMSEQLSHNPLVPSTVVQMIAAGEKTGKLGIVMNRVADFCEDEMNVAVKTVTSMIEPVMIIVMGLLVGGIAMALLLPVFSISKVMAH